MKKHDQRAYPRFIITNNGVVLVSQNLVVSHSLLDISKKGLAFRYRVNFGHEHWIGEEREIDLFVEDFMIVEVPVKIISDRPFDHTELDRPFNEEKRHLRRCSVQFSHLNSNQRNQIDYYVESLNTLSAQEQ